jgi:hypothetical protein
LVRLTVKFGNGAVSRAWTGQVQLRTPCGPVTLHNVLCVPGLQLNLISLSAVMHNGADIHYPLTRTVTCSKAGETYFTAAQHDELFVVDTDLHTANVH